MLHLASFTWAEGASIVALVGAIATGFVMVRKLGPEKDALFISSAQGAAVIMDSLISTLREEVDRGRAKITALEAENERLETENAGLREEADGLRRVHGRRRGDGNDAESPGGD